MSLCNGHIRAVVTKQMGKHAENDLAQCRFNLTKKYNDRLDTGVLARSNTRFH